jgi:hypothetical protein
MTTQRVSYVEVDAIVLDPKGVYVTAVWTDIIEYWTVHNAASALSAQAIASPSPYGHVSTDRFTEAADTTLSAHTGDSGGTWSLTIGLNTLKVSGANDRVEVS